MLNRAKTSHSKLKVLKAQVSLLKALKKFSEACLFFEWKETMKVKHNALVKNGTWIFVGSPLDAKISRNFWVYKTKDKADGTLEKYKARLVAQGFLQTLDWILLRFLV